jgi:23S rRNA pseudouridine1911/1915/1917 synthase
MALSYRKGDKDFKIPEFFGQIKPVRKIHFDIIYENEDFVAVNKPSGLLSIPAAGLKELSLKDLLKQKYHSIYTVHRLDRDTSGVIVFAKNQDFHKFISFQFQEKKVIKKYVGMVAGILSQKKGRADIPLAAHPTKRNVMTFGRNGKSSVTDFEVQEEFGTYSWLRFQIHSGRTHQIRVHMQYLGHPILCDELYGSGDPIFLSSFKRKFKLSKSAAMENPVLARLALHASSLQFFDAAGNDYLIDAPLPKDLKAFLQQLRKWQGS